MTDIKHYIAYVVENPDEPDELLLDLGQEICESLGWRPGDALTWQDQGNGTWVVTRKQDDSAVLP